MMLLIQPRGMAPLSLRRALPLLLLLCATLAAAAPSSSADPAPIGVDVELQLPKGMYNPSLVVYR
jgi:hypothetical protein